MTTMIEKVARAIAEKVAPALTGGEPVKVLDVARAAIEAMREPTPEMLRHLQMKTEIGSYVCENWTGAYGCMEEYHSAMIDAALKEKK